MTKLKSPSSTILPHGDALGRAQLIVGRWSRQAARWPLRAHAAVQDGIEQSQPKRRVVNQAANVEGRHPTPVAHSDAPDLTVRHASAYKRLRLTEHEGRLVGPKVTAPDAPLSAHAPRPIHSVEEGARSLRPTADRSRSQASVAYDLTPRNRTAERFAPLRESSEPAAHAP